MSTLTERAAAVVAKWEHGDEKHRQWLRDIAVPDLVAFVEAERATVLRQITEALRPFAEVGHAIADLHADRIDLDFGPPSHLLMRDWRAAAAALPEEKAE